MSNDETEFLQQQVLDGNSDRAVGELMSRYQARLERVVAFRMDRRILHRVDANDVVQDSFCEAVGRLDDYRAYSEKFSFFLWLRFLVLQKLTQTHRHHLGVAARDARRDLPMSRRPSTQATSIVLAAQLLGDVTSPSLAAVREEKKRWLDKALSEIEEIDREILALRHFEQLSNQEAAALLDLSPTATSNRYIRALRRLKQVMKHLADFNGTVTED